jgi:Tfp pilus assembly protein PilW
LVELLVAMSVTTVLIALMISVTTNVLNIWSRETGRLAIENQAAMIMDLVGEDLRGAMMKRDGRVWLAATIQNTQTNAGDAGGVGNSGPNNPSLTLWTASNGAMIKPGNTTPNTTASSLFLPAYTAPATAAQAASPTYSPDLTTYRFGQAGVWLRLFTSVAGANATDVSQASAPRAVGYQILRLKFTATGTSYHYGLFRSAARPFAATDAGGVQDQSTFDSGYDFFYTLTTSSPNTNHTNIPTNYNSAVALSGTAAQEAAGNIRRPNLQQLLGTNVIDFGVRFWGQAYDASGNAMNVLLFPASSNPTANPNLGFALSTEDGFTRRDDTTGAVVPAIQPPATSGWTAGGLMTWGYSYRSNGGTGTPDKSATPVFADIFVRILDDTGAQLIEAMENGVIQPPAGTTPGDFWWQTAENHSEIFTRRIPLLAAPM